jgi:hypothetical protein
MEKVVCPASAFLWRVDRHDPVRVRQCQNHLPDFFAHAASPLKFGPLKPEYWLEPTQVTDCL